MAKTSVDDLLDALGVIKLLEQAIGKRDQELDAVLRNLRRIEDRLDALEQRPAS